MELKFRAFRNVTRCEDGSTYGSGPQTLTGLQGKGTIRKAKGAPEEFPLEVFVDQTGAGSPTQGLITVVAPPDETILIPGFGVWDLTIFSGLGTVLRKTLVEGPILQNRAVTLAVV